MGREQLPEGWQLARLGKYCKKIGSGATPRGGDKVYQPSGVTLIRSQNVYNNYFERDGLAYIGNEHAKGLENVIVETGDVLINITGHSVARVCQVPDDILPARVNQHVSIVRPHQDRLDARYIRYVLVSPNMQQHMLALASAGATRNALTKGMIEHLQIPLPPLPIQRRIAQILGTLDDKIEQSRRMNATLEAIARALFRSWFVDFDPVRAKADGRDPPGMDAATAALFPAAFEDSPLGKVPRGWKVKGLDEIATFLNGLALQKYPPGGDDYLPVVKIAQMRKGNTEGADRASPNIKPEYIIHDGDVLFSWSGSLEVMIWCGGRGALNQHLFKVTAEQYPKWFYYLWTKHHLPEFQFIAAGKVTTMGHIQRHHLQEAKVLIPPADLLKAMDTILAPLIERITRNNVHTRTLAALRDALLPKLLSGDVGVGGERV